MSTTVFAPKPETLPDGPPSGPPAAIAVGEAFDGCFSCDEGLPENDCPDSQRSCGHHCNHSWTHDACCWCDKEFGETGHE